MGGEINPGIVKKNTVVFGLTSDLAFFLTWCDCSIYFRVTLNPEAVIVLHRKKNSLTKWKLHKKHPGSTDLKRVTDDLIKEVPF